MPFIAFNKATDPAAPDDLRINTSGVLYVEASRAELLGRTTIHMLGQASVVNAVTKMIWNKDVPTTTLVGIPNR